MPAVQPEHAERRGLAPLQGVQWLDHPTQRDANAEWRCLRSLMAGQAALLAVAAFRELRGRTAFLQVGRCALCCPLNLCVCWHLSLEWQRCGG